MTLDTSKLPELQRSEASIQQEIDSFAQSLDKRRLTILPSVINFVQNSSPDADDFAIVQAWNGRVFTPGDHDEKLAIAAVASLPERPDHVRQWWIDQINPAVTDGKMLYQLILPARSPRPSRTTIAAFGVIRDALAPYARQIPQLADLTAFTGDSMAACLYHYARLRHMAEIVGSTILPAVPKPDQAAAILQQANPNMVVDIGQIDHAQHMAARADWREHDRQPEVCPTCDTWVARKPFAINGSTALPCPYCYEPYARARLPSEPITDHPVELVIQRYTPPHYSTSNNFYTRVALRSALTPAQAHHILHPETEPAPGPAPCPMRQSCPTDCANRRHPFTNDGTHQSCLVFPLLANTANLSDQAAREYASAYLEQLNERHQRDRRQQANARKQAESSQADHQPEEPPHRQPTLL